MGGSSVVWRENGSRFGPNGLCPGRAPAGARGHSRLTGDRPGREEHLVDRRSLTSPAECEEEPAVPKAVGVVVPGGRSRLPGFPWASKRCRTRSYSGTVSAARTPRESRASRGLRTTTQRLGHRRLFLALCRDPRQRPPVYKMLSPTGTTPVSKNDPRPGPERGQDNNPFRPEPRPDFSRQRRTTLHGRTPPQPAPGPGRRDAARPPGRGGRARPPLTYAALARAADRLATRLNRWGVARATASACSCPRGSRPSPPCTARSARGRPTCRWTRRPPALRGAGIFADAG